MPDFRLERAHGGRVAGVDEAGRGPLAGPVVAAAVVFSRGVPRGLRPLLDDSKVLCESARLAAYAALRGCAGVEIGIGAASVGEIERLNILHASLRAMARALGRLPAPPDLALVDGNFSRGLEAFRTRCVVDGDAKSFSIAAASIVAKVTRDRVMGKLSARWPGYGFERNAGYGTALHRAGLAALGTTPHHRRGFGAVRSMLAGAMPELPLGWPVEAAVVPAVPAADVALPA